MKRFPLSIATVALSFATTAFAVPDHLQCIKVKDDIAKTSYTATITPDDPTFPAAAGCTIKLGAKLICVDSTKSAVAPAPPGAPDGGQPGKFFCYKAKCPTASTASFTGTDQFGSHTVAASKTALLCAPVDTVPPTTTTTIPPECVVAGDCPGTSTECHTITCTANTCGAVNASAGTQLMAQTSGDCQTAICDGMGGTGNQSNPMDPPADDGNDCTFESCMGSTPTHPAKPVGSVCSGGVCDGSGTCVECNAASDCPGSDTDCQSRSCTSGFCGLFYQPVGTPTTSQTPGDCKDNVCDGVGGTQVQDNNTDVPNDSQQCTSDVCTAGTPSHPPVPQNTACSQDGGTVCSASGTCVQCNQASQCPGLDTECQQRLCSANTCGLAFQPFGTPCSIGGTQCDGVGNCQ